jgi:hypothetical protein
MRTLRLGGPPWARGSGAGGVAEPAGDATSGLVIFG